MVDKKGDSDRLVYHPAAGYKFIPTDEVLVKYYLLNRVNQNPLPGRWIIQDCDVYGEKEPWQIWESLGGEIYNDVGFLYVFSFLKKKKGLDGSSNYNRNVGSSGGTWHGVSSGKTFSSGEISWTQKTFSYRNQKNKAEHGCWLMQEYSDPRGNYSNKIVLCRIKNNHKKRTSTESDEEDGRYASDQPEMGFKRSKVDAVPAPEIEENVDDSLASSITMGDNTISSTAAADPIYLEDEELMERVNSIFEGDKEFMKYWKSILEDPA